LTDRVDATQYVTPGVGSVCIANVGQRLRVAEDGQRLLELGKVVRTDEDRYVVPITGDGDSLVLLLDPVHHLREVVTHAA